MYSTLRDYGFNRDMTTFAAPCTALGMRSWARLMT
jgi:hypothetical protein